MERKFYFDKEVYSKPDHEFKFEFEKELVESICENKKQGRIIDLGCGEGGNAIELAKRGYEVSGIDISTIAIAKVKDFCIKNNIPIKMICADLDKYTIDEKYDVILSTGVFHFLSQGEVYRLISEAKKMTNKNGLNVFYVFSEGDPTQEVNNYGYYFKKGELENLYNISGWKIIAYEEFFEYDDKTLTNHKISRIIAKKLFE